MVNVSNIFSSKASLQLFLDRLNKQPFRAFYLNLVPKSIRNKWSIKANKLQKIHVGLCWEIFLEDYFSDNLDKFQFKAKKEFNNQKIIWQYWGQGVTEELPDIVKLCFLSVDQYKEDYKVIRLDETSISEYLDLPDFIFEKKKNKEFKQAFFADLIRLALLDVYGGVWIDATILLTAPIDNLILGSNYFMFQRCNSAENKEFWYEFNHDYFDWSNEQNVNILNSFIVGKKGNKVIHICLEILLNFWKTQNHIPHYFFFQIMFDVLIKRDVIEKPDFVIDDTLPHLLQMKINTKFNQVDFDMILSKINIHKMTYFSSIEEKSYYEYLKVFFNVDK